MSGFVFFRYPPSPALASFVECLWGVRGSAHYHVEAVLPNGSIELMVNFGPRQKVVAYGERRADDEFRTAWLAGIQDQPLVHAAPEGSNHVSARFRAGGAHAFFRVPMHELTDRVVELEDLVGRPAADRLWSRLAEVPAGPRMDERRCRALEAWLLERRAAAHPWLATVRLAADRLRRGAHATPVGELCGQLGLSNRHLIEQFRTVVGLTPKVYSRIARLQRVIDACRGEREPAWARLAVEHGFADQSHLIREFRRLALVTPDAFMAARTPDESHVVVA